MSKNQLRPPIKIQGGKWHLKKWIIGFFPEGYEQMAYCEPFCGGASIFLNKEKSEEEVIADVDKSIISIFKALRDEPKEFIQRIKRTKCTDRAYKMAQNRIENGFDDYIDEAVAEYFVKRMHDDQSSWDTMIEQLPEIAERLQGVSIINDTYINVFKVWDEENTLTYLDPPPLHTNRGEEIEDEDMTVEDHIEMLKAVNVARGKVVISGHSSPLYRQHLKKWKCKKRDASSTRIECLWMNY